MLLYFNNLNKIIKKESKKPLIKGLTNQQIKVGLCVIGKKENSYAHEFVIYYKKLGYNHIFIYDNNDINDEKFEDIFSKELSENFISIINYRGYRGKRNKPQFDAYYDCYQRNHEKYDWLSFFDFDEFLVLKNNSNIQQFLNQKKFDICDNIKINWMIYSDNDLIYYEDKPVQERFTTPLPNNILNKHIKSTIRGHLKINYWKNMLNPHSSIVNVSCCSPNGTKIDYNSPYNYHPNHDIAFIKHYETKTIEEYILKVKRGRSDIYIKINDEIWKNKFNYFFMRNNKTKEKLYFIKKVLNITII